MHLHKSGDMVFNSINKDGTWSDRKIQVCFDNLFLPLEEATGNQN